MRNYHLPPSRKRNLKQFKGRAMKEYVVLPKSLYRNKNEFSYWMNKSIDYVISLPSKKKKKE